MNQGKNVPQKTNTTAKQRRNKKKSIVNKVENRLLNRVKGMTITRKNQPQRKRTNPNKLSSIPRLMGVDKFPRNRGGKSGFGNKKQITISEVEYIQEINSNNSSTNFFMSATLPVNPGQASTFPWLSTIAANYQKYQFKFLEFFYQPEVTQYAPNNANIGKVILAAEYNSSLGAPNNKEDMEDIYPNANDMPYENIRLKLDPSECHRNSDAKFIRTAGLPGGSDIKTYDCANVYIAAQGQNIATTILGELHVRYTVILSDPIILGQLGLPNNYSVSQFVSNANEALTTATPYTMLLADTTPGDGYLNGLGIVNTTGSLVLPLGNYMMSYTLNFTTSGNSTGFFAYVTKNGTPNPVSYTNMHFPVGAYPDVTLVSTPFFVTSIGTESFKFIAYPTFSSGTNTANGTLVIVAV